MLLDNASQYNASGSWCSNWSSDCGSKKNNGVSPLVCVVLLVDMYLSCAKHVAPDLEGALLLVQHGIIQRLVVLAPHTP